LAQGPDALHVFYGKHDFKSDGLPTNAWLSEHLRLFSTPYPLALVWSPSEQVKKIRSHKLVGENLTGMLEQVLEHYGSYTKVKAARMHLYGGCYNFRMIKESVRLSAHTWCVGIDLEPEKNPLGENAARRPE